MPSSKGNSLLNNRAWVEARYGAAGWARVLAGVPEADAKILQQAVAVGWYDLGVEIRMVHAIHDQLLDGEAVLLDTMGRWIADRDFGGIHRLFFRLANPAYVLEKAMSFWSRYYDSGRWEITRLPHGADVRLLDFAIPDALFCLGSNGYIWRMFELVGAKEVSVEHPRCRGRGDAECLFLARWK